MIKKLVVLAALISSSFIGNSQVVDYSVHTKKIKVCEGSGISLTVPNSQLNTTYQLIDKDDNAIGALLAGNNDTLTFNSGALSSNDTLKIKAINSGSALNFNGTTTQLGIPNPNLGTEGISVAMWIKTTSTSQAVLAEKYTTSSGNKGFTFSMNANGTVKMEGGNGYSSNSIVTSTTAINDGNWHHIIGTFDIGTRAEIHVDGTKEATINLSSSPTFNFTGNLTIGNGSLGHFTGELDEITFFNRVTYPAEALAFVTSCSTPVPSQDLLGYYRFNEGVDLTLSNTTGGWASANINGGTPVWTPNFKANCTETLVLSQTIPVQVLNLDQISLSSNDLSLCPDGGTQVVNIETSGSNEGILYSLRDDLNDTLIGSSLAGTGAGLSFSTSPTASITYNVWASSGNAHAISLVGTTGNPYVDLTNNNRGIDKELTLSLWIKTTDVGTVKTILENTDANNDGYILETNTTGNVQFKSKLSFPTTTYKTTGFSTTAITDGAWHQITVAADITNTGGSLWKLYIDGIEESTASISSGYNSTFASSSATILGNSSGGITAEIDQLAIWNNVLTEIQIQENYNYCIPTNSRDLVALFNFNEGLGTDFNDLSSTAINGSLSTGTSIVWSSTASPSCETASCELEMTNTISVSMSNTNLTVAAVNPIVCFGNTGMVAVQNSEIGIKYQLINSVTNAAVGSSVNGTGATINLNSGAINSSQTFKVLAEVIPTALPSALNFDGIDNEVNLGTSDRGVNYAVTFSAWMKTSGPSVGNRYYIMSKLATYSGYSMWVDDAGKIQVYTRVGTTASASSGPSVASVDDNAWHYVTAVVHIIYPQSPSIKIYIDGVLDKTTTIPSGNTIDGSGATLIIGDDNSRNFNGQIDQFSLWNKILTQEEIQSKMSGCFDVDPNLRAHYNFNEGTGSMVSDLSVSAINGTLVGMDPTTDWVAGEISCSTCSFELTQTATIGAQTAISSVDTQSACGTYTWIDGNTYTNSNNTASHTLTSAAGCDSIVTLNLTVSNPTTGTDTQIACGSYSWIDGNTYTTSNSSATHTLTNSVGCDSIVTLNLTINNPTASTDVQTACGSYSWIDGNTYTSSNNSATHTLINSVGCDSVVTLNLTINNSTTGTDTQTACNSYIWIDGNTYTSSTTTATHSLTNSVGCDSLVTLNLTINATTSTDTQSACNTYTWIDGNTYTSSNNTATHTLTNVAGCDSIITLNLTINATASTDIQNACTSYTWIDGNTYTNSNNTATHTLTNVAGCDSVVTLNLTINPVDISTSLAGATISANNTTATSYQWINCSDNSFIAGETNANFTPTANGDYAVTITENTCEETSACITVTTVSISESNIKTFVIYPNPVKNQLFIALENEVINQLDIIDFSGRIVKSITNDNVKSIDVSELNKGVYFLKVQTEKGLLNSKFIKN